MLLLLFAPRKLPVRSPLPVKRTPMRVPRLVSNLSKNFLKDSEVVQGVVVEKPRFPNAGSVVLEIV